MPVAFPETEPQGKAALPPLPVAVAVGAGEGLVVPPPPQPAATATKASANNARETALLVCMGSSLSDSASCPVLRPTL